VRSVVAEGSFTLSKPDPDGTTYFRTRIFNTAKVGALETSVDWTYSSNELWMYMADGECTVDQFASLDCPGPACACKFSVASEAAVPKPRLLTVPNASSGTRTLVIWNLGPREDACAYQAVLTSTVAALAATARGTGESEMARKERPSRFLGRR
jgi:hypothetical protein